ncbi:hypothetical protein D3C84_964120 [compost metagenome]
MLTEQIIQKARLIVGYPGRQHQMLIRSNGGYRIDLHAFQQADHVQHLLSACLFIAARLKQLLFIQ